MLVKWNDWELLVADSATRCDECHPDVGRSLSVASRCLPDGSGSIVCSRCDPEAMSEARANARRYHEEATHDAR